MKKAILDDLRDTEVLLIEDDIDLSHLLKKTIKRHTKAFYTASTGQEALKIFKEKKPHMIIVDLELPGMSGIDFMKEVRMIDCAVNIVVITAHATENNFVASYDLGICSILKKPIDLDELFMILLSHTPKKVAKKTVSLGNCLSYEPSEMILYYNAVPIVLTKKENQILLLLLERKGNVVPYDDFKTAIWGDLTMTLDTLRMHINSIRKKSHQNIIRNLSGVGYKLTID